MTEQRAAVAPRQREKEAEALVEAVSGLEADTVCCYVPFGTEPGSLALLDVLRERGTTVLLPVVPATPGALGWAVYDGASTLVAGRLPGVREPAGERLGPAAIGTADVVLVPALAVDKAGIRLGRGAGYYDRSLALSSPQAELIGVIRDTELVSRLPAEAHDVPMTAALTPGFGVIRLPCSSRP